MSHNQWPDKDPGDILDYILDYVNLFASGENISTTTWTLPTGLTKVQQSESGQEATIRLSGGTDGTAYTLTAVTLTTSGQTFERDVLLRVRNQ